MAAIFEEFANGEDFNASDFNTLVMRQAVIACDNQTDRDSILTPQEGLTVYRKDTDAIEIYDGSAWLTYDTKWQTYTPTYNNLTIGNGTVVAKYFRSGKKIDVDWSLVLGTTSSIGVLPDVSLPITRASSYGSDWAQPLDGTAYFLDQPPGACNGCITSSTSAFRLYCIAASGSAAFLSIWGSANPITFATGDTIGGRFSYIAA